MSRIFIALTPKDLFNKDILDSSTLLRARDNDELGDYVGDMDFEQTRVFNQPYSMAELLKIDDHITTTELNSYTDDTYWDLDGDGIGNTFQTESCVGMIFINDNMDYLICFKKM